jgi:ATP-dependent DNA helicase PIF1
MSAFPAESLSPEQQYAFDKFKQGHNLFITGPGGTGKTKLIHHLRSYCANEQKRCQVCALTGCAALLLNCGAKTIHSWSGIKLCKGRRDVIISNVIKSKKAMRAWKTAQILIVDEVSMMSLKIFEVLEEIGRMVRKNARPFGGIQVVFLGDFFQLPPVGSYDDPDTEKFCFESPKWHTVFPLENHVELTTMFRQRDPAYIKILLEIRRGTISEESKATLLQYVKREYKPEEHAGCLPTKLFAVKNKVEFVNTAMFKKIEEEEHTYDAEIKTDCLTYLDTGKLIPQEILNECRKMSELDREWEIDNLLNNMPCTKSFSLKKGSVVMCTYNLDVDNGICNGSQGIVVDIVQRNGMWSPLVKFHNGLTIFMERQYWQSDEFPTLAVGQIPLCLAWAMTIHKIQGATLAFAEMDLGNTIFENGQIYVALSRIQSLDGLYLSAFHAHKIRANAKVIEFYKTIPPLDISTAVSPPPLKNTSKEIAPVPSTIFQELGVMEASEACRSDDVFSGKGGAVGVKFTYRETPSNIKIIKI